MAGTLNNAINVQAPNKPTIAVSTGTVLTSTAFGSLITCTGSTAYTVTLPSATNNAGLYIDFTIITTSNALVTIAPAAGTIDGQSNIVYGSNEGCTLYCDGTNWTVIWQSLMPVVLWAASGNTQSVPNNSMTSLTIYSSIFSQVGSFYNTTTNTYTPLYPGKYFLCCVIGTPSVTWTGQGQLQLLGTNATITHNYSENRGAATTPSFEVSGIMKFNGSTDNVLPQFLQITGASMTVGNNGILNYMGFHRISNY